MHVADMSILPSWNDGPTKAAILDFIERVTRPNSSEFVLPAHRIAVFDNDGTLWCEQPLQVQAFFLLDRLKTLAAQDPTMQARQPFQALLQRDLRTLHELGKRGIAELFFAIHAGMTVEEFAALARWWLADTKHPRFGRPFTQCVFKPQLELLEFLQRHSFKTYVVTGGGVDFVRAFAEDVYRIPPEQVIGSSAKLRFEVAEGRTALTQLAELHSFDDHEAKPANIALHIGRAPLLACGNSDGDLAMLRYARSGRGARLALLLHHDDDEREVSYDRDFEFSPLAEALDRADDYGITLVSMRRDWARVF